MPNFKVGDKAVCVNMVWPRCRHLNGTIVTVVRGLHKAHWNNEPGLRWCYGIKVPDVAGAGITRPHKLRPLIKPKPLQQCRRVKQPEPA